MAPRVASRSEIKSWTKAAKWTDAQIAKQVDQYVESFRAEGVEFDEAYVRATTRRGLESSRREAQTNLLLHTGSLDLPDDVPNVADNPWR